MRGKFNFLYGDIWFNKTKCKFIKKNSSFKMLVVFSPIFVGDTKITFVYNSLAPLERKMMKTVISFMLETMVDDCFQFD